MEEVLKRKVGTKKEHSLTVEGIENITDSTYKLIIEKGDISFKAGQYFNLGIPGIDIMREYSVYSGENDSQLEFLIKEVDNGELSKKLRYLTPGSQAKVVGPNGYFILPKGSIRNDHFVFIASGTGIAPFHSYIKSYPALSYDLIHGVRFGYEAYGKNDYREENYTLCTTGDYRGKFHGRLTDYLQTLEPDPDKLYYLCGNSRMIYDAMDILSRKGVSPDHMFMEAYF